MESLLNLKRLLSVVGQYSISEVESLWYKFYGFFACTYMCIFLAPTFYLATTLNSVEQFAAIIPVWVGVCNGTFKGCFLRFYSKEVKSLLENIEKNVNAQILKGRPEKYYKAANITSDILVNGFQIVMGICGWAPIIGPPAYALYHYFRETLTDDKIKTPIPALLPYDLTNLPAYLSTCISYAVTINFWVFSIAAVDTFFMSLCVTLNGCFKDLMDMFSHNDELLEFPEEQVNDNKQRFIAMKEGLKACVKYHNDIFSLIRQFQHLVGPVVFAQYFFSLFQLGTLVFATIMIPGIQPDVIVFNITLMVACLTELSIYCYFGSELTTTANEVSISIYGCKWYKYHPNLRKYIGLSMIRAQKVTHIRGFYMVIASMETFSLLINLIASAFTLLKSTVGK